METPQRQLDLVLPCYNPLEGWHMGIIDNMATLSSALSDTTIHLIIVNDGSKVDIPKADIDAIRKAVPHFTWVDQRPNAGKGAALRRGMQESKADFVVFTDIDFPYIPDSTLSVCQSVLEGDSDIVVGQRAPRYYEKTPWQREVVSKLLKAFNKHILRIPVSDTQCGLKGFNKKGKEVFLETTINRYLFDLEFLILASRRKRNLKIEPQMVTLRDDVVFSKLNLSILTSEVKNIIRIIFTAWMR